MQVFRELIFSKPNDGFGSCLVWWLIQLQRFIKQYPVHAQDPKVVGWCEGAG